VTVRKRRDSIQGPYQADIIDSDNSQNTNDNALKQSTQPVKQFTHQGHSDKEPKYQSDQYKRLYQTVKGILQCVLA